MSVGKLTWFKSSYSNTAGVECVEAAASTHSVLIRDSKHRNGPHLSVPRAAWVEFIAGAGEWRRAACLSAQSGIRCFRRPGRTG
ncbi:DUF397 domain-containing protein [Streptomyces thioluteus]|uniref:DUF397 domain-containing protein n=1 Tax=Streptomyces thioluteus TaxID=66431 RepID=UPI0031E9D4FB